MGDQKKTTELRLALVCYGGVSLAIYMHGVTKELHKLVRAARAFDEMTGLDAANPFPDDKTESAYFEALRAVAKKEDGRRLSVSIDIIAGASAGGINGVVLAKAIARDAEQEKLKELWIKEGDLKKLLRGAPFGGLRFRAATAAVSQLVNFRKPTSPLKGERMSELLVGALKDMDATGSGSRDLMPKGGQLELFVTVTDLNGFSVLVPAGSGGASQRDRSHEQIVEFRARPGETGKFGPGANSALGFAARATSSFPGAFAPVSVGSFVTESRQDWSPDEAIFRYPYGENSLALEDAWFVDGGTLNNAPFDLAVDAVAKRPADGEVLRRIIYIQPDPGRPLGSVPAAPDSDEPPREAEGYLASLWQALGGARTSHSIVPDLLKIRDMNWRIAQVGTIVEQQEDEVLGLIDAAVQQTGAGPGGALSLEQAGALATEMHAEAGQRIGAGLATYQRLKLEAAARRVADEISHERGYPPDSARATFVRAAMSAWARSLDEWDDDDPARLVDRLRRIDVPYRERRLLFLLAGINRLYGQPDGPPPADLDTLKGEAWRLLEGLRSRTRATVKDLTDEDLAVVSADSVSAALYTDPKQFATDPDRSQRLTALFDKYGAGMDAFLDDSSTSLWTTFQKVTGEWPDGPRRGLLSRYLGFPLWDGLIFPVISLSELPQLTPMAVTQFSPLAASALEPMAQDKEKLKGVSFHHFSAFFEQEYRENDYLWGRLDGAELIMRTLFGEGKVVPVDALEAAGGRPLAAALRAILASESDLATVENLRQHIAQQVDDLEAQLGG